HTRAKRATPGWTRLQSTEKSPAPASRIAVGCEAPAFPKQLRWRRQPPRSISCPGGGRGGKEDALWPWAISDTLNSRSAGVRIRLLTEYRRSIRTRDNTYSACNWKPAAREVFC